MRNYPRLSVIVPADCSINRFTLVFLDEVTSLALNFSIWSRRNLLGHKRGPYGDSRFQKIFFFCCLRSLIGTLDEKVESWRNKARKIFHKLYLMTQTQKYLLPQRKGQHSGSRMIPLCRDLWALRRMIWGKFASFIEEMEIRKNYLKHSETTPSCDGLFAMKSIFWCSSFLGRFFVGICWELCGCGVSFKLQNFFNIQDQVQLNSNQTQDKSLFETETYFNNFPSNPTFKSFPTEFQIKIKGYEETRNVTLDFCSQKENLRFYDRSSDENSTEMRKKSKWKWSDTLAKGPFDDFTCWHRHCDVLN